SGKTSLAIDTLGAEGQRRYLETFSSYARQFLGGPGHSHARAIDGLPPAVMVTQRGHSPSSRSTVGTLTQLHDLLRLLFARFGEAPPTAVTPLTRSLFSFHHPSGACPLCLGVGVEDRLDPDRLVADASRTIRQGALTVSLPNGYLMYSQVTLDVLDQVCRAHGFDVDTPWKQLSEEQRRVVLNGSDRIRVPYGKHPLESRLRWKGIAAKPRQEGTYQGILPVMEEILRRSRNPRILRFVRSLPCSACNGARLRPEALAVTLDGANIAHLSSLPMTELRAWFEHLDSNGTRGAAMEPIRRSALQLLGVDRPGRGLPAARPGHRRVVLRRRSTAPARQPWWPGTPGRALRPRRALGRPARGRSGRALRAARKASRSGQLDRRGRARSAHDRSGRLDRGHRSVGGPRGGRGALRRGAFGLRGRSSGR
ncbi:MAG TPA: hypothetical protein PLI95_23630, partial [Polyangiaceae bacterium]|nr:hypothetical protein [Polyangiaceae bacterium]